MARIVAALATIALVWIPIGAAPAADRNAEAQALQMKGDWNGLKQLATDWSSEDSASAEPWIYLGLADDQLGQTSDAAQAYEKGLALNPGFVTGWMYLAADYHKLGQPQKVAEIRQKLQAINPSMAMMLQSQYPQDLQAGPLAPGGNTPNDLPNKAAAGLARARQWRPDAELMSIEINDYANNGNFQISYYFFSPSDATGLMVNENGALPVGPANWGTNAIPDRFLDLPAALEVARRHGMTGPFNGALLRVGDHGLTWTIHPRTETATVEDPYMRKGAFEIPAEAP